MDQDTSKNESRRRFIKTAGKFAIYTPPVLMLMSKSSHATFSKSGTGHGHKDYKKYYSKYFRKYYFRKYNGGGRRRRYASRRRW